MDDEGGTSTTSARTTFGSSRRSRMAQTAPFACLGVPFNARPFSSEGRVLKARQLRGQIDKERHAAVLYTIPARVGVSLDALAPHVPQHVNGRFS